LVRRRAVGRGRVTGAVAMPGDSVVEHLISRYPRGIVGKVLVFHLNVKGSIPTPATIFLCGFYHEESTLLSPLRGTERERERGLIKYMDLFHI
jgi:hypothetical protein